MAFRLNPFTSQLDWVVPETEIARIACEEAIAVLQSVQTTDTNALGNKNFFYDPVACKWVEAGPQVLYDANGEVVIGEDCE